MKLFHLADLITLPKIKKGARPEKKKLFTKSSTSLLVPINAKKVRPPFKLPHGFANNSVERMKKKCRTEELNLIYAAYGSNMDPKQMAERCPGAKFIRVHELADHILQFSGYTGVANVKPKKGRKTPLVLYKVNKVHMKILDHYEGVSANKYQRNKIVLTDVGEVILYKMSENAGKLLYGPSDFYISKILAGCTAWKIPPQYVQKAKDAAEKCEEKRRPAFGVGGNFGSYREFWDPEFGGYYDHRQYENGRNPHWHYEDWGRSSMSYTPKSDIREFELYDLEKSNVPDMTAFHDGIFSLNGKQVPQDKKVLRHYLFLYGWSQKNWDFYNFLKTKGSMIYRGNAITNAKKPRVGLLFAYCPLIEEKLRNTVAKSMSSTTVKLLDPEGGVYNANIFLDTIK